MHMKSKLSASPVKADSITANLKTIKRAGFLTLALSNPLRQKVLTMLLKKGRCGVTELHTRTRTEQSIMSQHLKVLKDAKLVLAEREGKRIYYSVNKQVLASALAHVKGMAGL